MNGTTVGTSIRPRMGTLPPRYSLVLNPDRRERFTRCPRCEASTRIRKISRYMHLNPAAIDAAIRLLERVGGAPKQASGPAKTSPTSQVLETCWRRR
jgi:hypothetical protein